MKKVLSLVVMLCMIVTLVSFTPSNALTDNASVESSTKEILPRDCVPEIIPYSQVEQARHVKRLYSQEVDLDCVTFENADGTNSTYIFAEDVKYIDENGNVQDKSNRISPINDEKSVFGYTNEKNDVKTYFPKRVENGVKLAYNGIEITLHPINSKTSAPKVQSYVDNDKIQNDSVIYPDVFGENTAISYSCLFEGFKEDIILYKNIGTNKFGFILKTNGLILKETNGNWLLYDKDEPVGKLGNLYVYDNAQNVTYDNKIEVKNVEPGVYELTLVIDEGFLKSAEYPVIIDPTMTVNSTGSGSNKSIQDTTVFNFSPYSGQNYGSGSISVGMSSPVAAGSRGVAYSFIKFPGMTNKFVFKTLDPSQITACNMYYREIGDTSSVSASIRMYMYRGNVWDENTLTYNTADIEQISASHGTMGIVGGGWYNFPIPNMAKNWCSGTEDPDKGLLLVNLNESSYDHYRVFASSEAASYKPYITLTYTATAPLADGVYKIKNNGLTSNNYLSFGAGEATATLTSYKYKNSDGKLIDGDQLWYVKNMSSNIYTLYPMGTKVDMGTSKASAYFQNSTQIYKTDYNGSSGDKFYIIKKGSDYYILPIMNDTLAITVLFGMPAFNTATMTDNYSKWSFMPIDKATFNNYWPGEYVGQGTKKHIKIKVNSSVYTNSSHTKITSSMFDQIAPAWNGISPNIVVYGPNDTVPAGITPFVVTYYGDTTSNIGDDIFGNIDGITALGEDAVGDWIHANIRLNVKSNSPISSADRALYTIFHEFSHALKVGHPNDNYVNPYVQGRGTYYNNENIAANLNSGSPDSTNSPYRNNCEYPQWYDIINVKNKWD